jgi:hypothetical protein
MLAEGQTRVIYLAGLNVQALGAFEAQLSFDPRALEVIAVAVEPFASSGGRTLEAAPIHANVTGARVGAYSRGSTGLGASGDGTLMAIAVRAKVTGAHRVRLSEFALRAPDATGRVTRIIGSKTISLPLVVR